MTGDTKQVTARFKLQTMARSPLCSAVPFMVFKLFTSVLNLQENHLVVPLGWQQAVRALPLPISTLAVLHFPFHILDF